MARWSDRQTVGRSAGSMLRVAGLMVAIVTAGPAQTADRASVLAADRTAAERSEACGFACGLGAVLADDAWYLHNGIPVVQGAATIRSFLLAQDTLLSHRVQWQALSGQVSADGSFGVTWGVTTVGLRGGPVRFGRYITAWRRDDDAWRIAGHVQTGLNAVAEVTRPAGWSAPALPLLAPTAVLLPFVEADRAFAGLAGREGAATGFATYAAPDAVVFGGTGELIRGPEAIRAAFAGPASAWEWEPVAVGGAADGSLGFTIGEATIRRRGADGTESVSRSKYLTVWTRLRDGTVRYRVDAGNSR